MLDIRTDEIKGAQLYLRQADREIRRAISRATGTSLRGQWRDLVRSYARSAQERALFRTGGLSMSQTGKGYLSVNGRNLSGGLTAGDGGQWPAVEFGSNRYRQLPPRNPSGYVVYRSVQDFAPYATRVWLRTIADNVREGIGVD